MFIFELPEAHVDSGRKSPDQQIQIEKERRPSCWLMFGNRCDDWNVDFSITSVPERIESTAPGGNDSRNGEADQTKEGHTKDSEDSPDK
jgi:hypothetical protein